MIQDVSFACKIGVGEHLPCVLRDPEQRDSIIDAGVVRVGQPLKFAREALLVLPKILRDSYKDVLVDSSIDMIEINLLHPLADVVMVPAQPIKNSRVLTCHNVGVLF